MVDELFIFFQFDRHGSINAAAAHRIDGTSNGAPLNSLHECVCPKYSSSSSYSKMNNPRGIRYFNSIVSNNNFLLEIFSNSNNYYQLCIRTLKNLVAIFLLECAISTFFSQKNTETKVEQNKLWWEWCAIPRKSKTKKKNKKHKKKRKWSGIKWGKRLENSKSIRRSSSQLVSLLVS